MTSATAANWKRKPIHGEYFVAWERDMDNGDGVLVAERIQVYWRPKRLSSFTVGYCGASTDHKMHYRRGIPTVDLLKTMRS